MSTTSLRFSLPIGCILLLACMLDNLFIGLSIFLGTMSLIPIFFQNRFPLGNAATLTFLLGLLMDSTHGRIPFGFNAFYGLALLLMAHSLRRYLRPEMQKRWLIFIAIFTPIYYILLSIWVHPLHYVSGLISLVISLLFNEICWILFPRRER